MSRKYAALGAYLETQTGDDIHLSFGEVETILGSPLPSSASKHIAWWSNSPVQGRHNEVWLKHGWESADLNLKARTIRFRRMGRKRTTPTASRQRKEAHSLVSDDLAPSPIAPTIDMALKFDWRSLGAITLDEKGALSFPSVTASAGLYRIRINGAARPQIYIGESSSLRRRFGNYRSPGPTQQTSLRINALLQEALIAGSDIAVDIVTDSISLCINGEALSVDLSNKAVRRMIEHTAIVACGGEDIDIANR